MRKNSRTTGRNGMFAPAFNIRRGIGALALVLMAVAAALAMTAFPGNTQAQATEEQARVSENAPGGTIVGTPLQAESSGGPPTYSLSGPDAGSFIINPRTGQVSLAQDASPDFEIRADYQVTVTAAALVTIQVINVNEPGTVGLSADEPGAGETVTATLEDPDGGVSNTRWSWARLDGSVPVDIPGADGASYTTVTADIGRRLSATARYDDAAGTGQQASSTTAGEVRNDPPAFAGSAAAREVLENTAPGTPVGAPIAAADPNGHRVSYLVTGSDSFQADPDTGQLRVAQGAKLDHEARDTHRFTLTATDPHGGQASIAVTVNVTNAEEPGTLALQHGELRRGTVINAVLEDPDGGISGESWQWSRSGDPMKGATGSSYTAGPDDVGHILSARVSYQDGHGPGKSASADTASAVGNDPPAFSAQTFTRSIDENAPSGASVGNPITASDPNEDTVTYRIDGNAFSIDPGTGTITADSSMDHEQEGQYTLTVTATDDHGAEARAEVLVTVNNIDEPGTVALSNSSPRAGDTITASLADPDGEPTGMVWQWQRGGADIPGASSSSYTVAGADLGHVIGVTVGYTDPQGPGKRASASTDEPVQNDPPSFTEEQADRSIPENSNPGTGVGEPLEASDPNGDSLTFKLLGDDAGSFAIDGNGRITSAAPLDHEAQPVLTLTAAVQDPAGGSDSMTVTVRVENVEEAGTVILRDGAQPQVNIPVEAALSDPDGSVSGPAWTWQRADSADGPWTEIAGANASSYTPQTSEIDSYLRATVSYTDGHGDDQDTADAVTGAPVKPEPNRPPAFGEHTATFNISINVREGVRVAPPFTAEDPNGDTLAYSIVSNTPGAFTINAATGEVLMGSLELEEGSTHTATITVTDGVNAQWQEDMAADDSLDLTMTIVNPNIVIQPSSTAAFPNGLWVDDDIVVTTNSGSRNWARYYDRDTQQHLSDRSFRIRTGRFDHMRGVWSDGDTLYVLTADRNWTNPKGKVFAYSLSDGSRQKSMDISLPASNAHPAGLTGRDGILYVGDSRDRKVYAYGMESGNHQSGDDINGIDTLRKEMTDIWTDGDTIWVSYWLSGFIRAYDMDTGERNPGLDVQLARENAGPTGIDSDGFNLWALDQVNDTIYGYVVPR